MTVLSKAHVFYHVIINIVCPDSLTYKRGHYDLTKKHTPLHILWRGFVCMEAPYVATAPTIM